MRAQLLVSSLMILVCLFLFILAQKSLSDPWIELALDREVNALLAESMVLQRKLSTHEPENEAEYRALYQRTREKLQHREVLLTTRDTIRRRYYWILSSTFALSLLLIAGFQFWYLRRRNLRLQILQRNLEKLAANDFALESVAGSKDLVGRIATMIAEAAEVMQANRKRLRYLENLEIWRDSARRIAHEIRTPLTAIRLELRQLVRGVVRGGGDRDQVLEEKQQSILEELARLSEFTDAFSSFAKLPAPQRKSEDLGRFLDEFAQIYEHAWTNMTVTVSVPPDPVRVSMDRRMVRQVIVNLANNSAKALGERTGSLDINLETRGGCAFIEVADDGPGMPEEMREIVFEPYVTGNPVGEGMGLGLAISRKIMLDHDGDITLIASHEGGTFFHVFLPLEPEGAEPSEK
ncbi:sensor histidine kinase [Acanthopleuribacter pedis]|uniref:histidine kinase n=1 Tax=Acanthopleuribacter pedis TaxID=442870 RepID=A0A8J7Q9K6_9BACT|nr:ATP-binding protein [Acanthopleuribacter pedis]MBO1320430.1 hypothetical protein [Acanthopleuribacter pedis]